MTISPRTVAGAIREVVLFAPDSASHPPWEKASLEIKGKQSQIWNQGLDPAGPDNFEFHESVEPGFFFSLILSELSDTMEES